MEAFIKRIEEINPLLNCVVEHRFKGALQDAAAADELIASGTLTEEELATQKPFLGVPISTKDAIMVKGKSSTSSSWLILSFRGLYNSYIISSQIC